MKINIAKSAGFCMGVKRAVKIALEAAKKNKSVEMLGDIVHNEDVVKQIKKAGIKKINSLTDGKNKILLIRAHGTCKKTMKKAQQSGYQIIDATCPMVKGIHKIAREMERKNFDIIIIGDKFHDEVHGIAGQLDKKALIIENAQNIPIQKIKKIKKACVVVQSTQTLENAKAIIKKLKPHIKELRFFNTICRPTQNKQNEIKTMPLKNDVMLIVGSATSANTRRLYEISKSLNKNTYWVQSKKNLKKKWFTKAKQVGITAGSSTPDSTTKSIMEFLEKLK